MELRHIELPNDLAAVTDAATSIFQYADRPEWSMQPDEQSQLTEGMQNFRRVWPLLRVLQPFSSQL